MVCNCELYIAALHFHVLKTGFLCGLIRTRYKETFNFFISSQCWLFHVVSTRICVWMLMGRFMIKMFVLFSLHPNQSSLVLGINVSICISQEKKCVCTVWSTRVMYKLLK